MSSKESSRGHHSRHEKPPSAEIGFTTNPTSSDALFTIDRKGDSENLRYGSIDKYKVPRYRTIGYGRLVGLDRRFKQSPDSAPDRQISDESLDTSNKNHSFPLLLKKQHVKEPLQLVHCRTSSQDEFIEQQSYVSLGSKKRKVSTDAEKQSIAQLSFVGEGGFASAETSDSDSESSTYESTSKIPLENTSSFETFKNHPDNKKFIELRNRTESHPQDYEAWLEFINHQEQYFKLLSATNNNTLTASEQRTVTDMKIALYEKAIASVKDDFAMEKLILGMMREGAKIWDTDKLSKEWNLVLLRRRDSINLWYEYLNFQQTNVITFSYEQCLEFYLEVLGIVSTLKDVDHDHQCVYLTTRLTTFMSQAGFTERAIAIWQALLEYNIMVPANSDPDIGDLELFWEEECPRIGEPGARGWLSDTEQEAPTKTDQALSNLDAQDLFSEWAKSEVRHSTSDIMPGRVLDDTIEDDQFRMILFYDIRDFLFRLKSDQGKDALIQGFLKFCGLPPMYDPVGSIRKWWINPFLCDFHPDLQIGELTDTGTLFTPSTSPISIWRRFKSMPNNVLEFCLRALHLILKHQYSNDKLAEYIIAAHVAKDPISARKLAKGVLKHRSNSLLLYNAYAFVELRSQRTDVANNVWSTALTMASTLGSGEKIYTPVLWHSWIWELMEQNEHSYALSLLVTALPIEVLSAEYIQMASKPDVASAAQKLKTEAFLRDKVAVSLSQGDESVVDYTSLLAIFRYLSNEHDLDEALRVFQSTLPLIDQKQFLNQIERLHQIRARLANLHAISARLGYRPMQLIPLFEESVSTFPTNAIFSHFYEKYLRQAGVIDRVRLLDKTIEDSQLEFPSLIRTISRELSRPAYAGSTEHSIRHAFTHATATDSAARRCVYIWLFWIGWELSLNSVKPGIPEKRAKEVYLSALSACPWSKDLYLQGFSSGLLMSRLGSQESEQIYRTMRERGLRIRHDIIDYLE